MAFSEFPGRLVCTRRESRISRYVIPSRGRIPIERARISIDARGEGNDTSGRELFCGRIVWWTRRAREEREERSRDRSPATAMMASNDTAVAGLTGREEEPPGMGPGRRGW